MNKKKYLIGLSILLLVLLLGLSSTCYADTNNIWTKNQLKNVIYNYQIYCNRTETQANQWLDSFDSNLNTILNTINQYNNVYITFQTGRTFQAFYIGFMNDNSNYWYVYNGCLSSTGNTSKNYYWVFTNGTMDTKMGYGMANTYSFNTDIYYFSKNVYTNSGHGTIKYSAGSKPSTLLTSPFTDDHFDFTYDDNISFASLHDSQGYFGEVALVPKGTISIKLGELEQAQFIDYIIKQKMKYNKYTGFFDTYSAETITSWTDSDDVYNVFVNGNDIANIFVLYTAYSNDSDFLPLNYSYFITDNMTIISGDSIELALTFNDDNYYNDYSNSIQNEQDEQAAQDRTDEIINTITDDSQVTGMLNDFGSGDINTFASKFGLPSIPNPFSNFIETIFYGITDVLTLDGDVSLNFGILGTINSSQFTTPTNAVTIFVSSFLTFIFVYYMIELGYSTLMSIREFNLDKSGIYHVEGMHPESGLQADGSWRLL